ncbi:uncharacterized protein L203_105673 [Cryptococcus depauperatus CBS 7841]|uniref:DNA polymerase delta subunit 4 n=1 Tax=Cryptococcus depauperatus CBS 7841 TaxID=1295531 RepID=A0AAJ8M467_9TREE
MTPKITTSAASKKARHIDAKEANLSQPMLSFQSRTKPSKALIKSKPSLKHRELTTSNADVAASSDGVDIVAQAKNTEEKNANKKLDVRSKRWAGLLKQAKAAMGDLEPIHAGPETHNDIHHILRVFDMTTRYGPCVGMSRLQRWERAKLWELDPPEEIRVILTTLEGKNDPSYRDSVLHEWL